MDETKQITETEADLMIDRVLMVNRIFHLVDDLEEAILIYLMPMLDSETARKFNNYAKHIENMRKEVKREFQYAFTDLKANMNTDIAKG